MTGIKSLRIIFHVAPVGLDDVWGVAEIALLVHGVHTIVLGDLNHFEVLQVFLSCLGGTGGRSVLLVIVLFGIDNDLASPPFPGANVQMKHFLWGMVFKISVV